MPRAPKSNAEIGAEIIKNGIGRQLPLFPKKALKAPKNPMSLSDVIREINEIKASLAQVAKFRQEAVNRLDQLSWALEAGKLTNEAIDAGADDIPF